MTFFDILDLVFIIFCWFYVLATTAMFFTHEEKNNKMGLLVFVNGILLSVPLLALYRYIFQIDTASLSPRTFLIVIGVFTVLGALWTQYPFLLFKLMLGIENIGYSKAFRSVFYDGQKINVADPSSFRALESESYGHSKETDYGKDNHHVYYRGARIEDVDAASFEILEILQSGEAIAKSKSGLIYEGGNINEKDLVELRRSIFGR